MSGGHHHHHHGHQHGHHHGHHHGSASSAARPAFALAVALNLGFVVAEVAAGLVSGSIALIADAGHNLSDVLSLVLAWVANVLASRPASERYTYGLKSASILAAIANAALLWAAIGAILLETIRRLADPAPVGGSLMIVVAAAGILVNGASALLFAKGSKTDLNLRAAFVHLLADAAVSAGVVIAGVLIALTGRPWIDPAASLLVTVVIGWSSWGLLKDALRLGMLGVPMGIELPQVRGYLESLPGVTRVHDLHVWPMSTTESALTAHLVRPGPPSGDAFLHDVAHELDHRFGIGHSTLQVESGDGTCALQRDAAH